MLARASILSLLISSAVAQLDRSKSFVLFVFPPDGQDLPQSVAHVHLAPLPLRDGDYLVTSSHARDTVFFVNATTSEPSTWTTNWDASGPHSWGLSLDVKDGTAHLKPGNAGQQGVAPATVSPPSFQRELSWRFCDVAVEEHDGKHFNVLRARWRDAASRNENVSAEEENCVRVEVIPFSAPRPSDAGADMSHAELVSCYMGGDN